MRSYKWLILLVLGVYNTFVVGQNTSIALDQVNSSEMTGSDITSLSTDHKGYLWVGTSNGLNRYDGYDFIAYRSYKTDTNSLSHPFIQTINQFSNDELLIGTSQGLNAYSFDNNKFTRIKIDTTLANVKKKNSITCLAQLKDGRIVAGSADGIIFYDKEKRKLRSLTNLKTSLLTGHFIQSMCIDQMGNLWVGTKHFADDGGIRFRVFKYSFTDKKLTEFALSEYGSSGHVGISVDQKGMIWVAIDDGLMSVDPLTYEKTFYKAPNAFLSNVSYFHSKDNYIYQGYWSFGVTVFDVNKKTYEIVKNDPDNSRSLMSNKVWALFKDYNGVVWYGTEVGLQKQSNRRANIEVIRRKAEFTENTFTSNQLLSVWASRKQKDKIFVAVDGNGFSIFDRSTQRTENFTFGGRGGDHKVEERFINQFVESEDGSVYAAGQYNFLKININNKLTQVKHYFYQQQHHFTCVFQDHTNKNILWLGGLGQIVRFDMTTEKFEFISKPANSSDIFYSGISNQHGTIFTSKNAIIKIKPDQSIKRVYIPDAGNISCIEEFDDNHVILGTSFLGLIRYNLNNNTYEVIRNNRDAFFSEVKCIKKVKNTFWIGTTEGLYQYYPFSNDVREYGLVDGLPSNIIQSIDHDGFLYLATTNGLVVLNPKTLATHFTIPKIDITSIIGIGNDVEIISNLSNKQIEIPQSQNSFKINFTALDFNLPEKNSYKYKLLPIQNVWKNSNHDHSVSFNELSPGEYEFQVIGSNSDNIWNTAPVSVKIRIVPPIYNSKPFYYILGFTILLLIVIIFYSRYMRIKNNQAYLERTIEERTEEIRVKQKQLERTNVELIEGITYAQKIQKAFLVGEKILTENLPESFIYFKPKEKVSGDFFWIGREDGYLIIAAGDCTGHGVPGALLSVIATTLLNKIIHEEKVLMPGSILSELNYNFYHQLNVEDSSLRDGLDISIIAINLDDEKLFFCGARNNGSMIANGAHKEFMAQRESIGENERVEFATVEIEYNKNATYYLYSDGYKDQFGGRSSKKLASKTFKDILVKASKLAINGQSNYFKRLMKDWQGENSQTDDRLIIGFKLH